MTKIEIFIRARNVNRPPRAEKAIDKAVKKLATENLDAQIPARLICYEALRLSVFNSARVDMHRPGSSIRSLTPIPALAATFQWEQS